jgi:chromosome segregation ATPase
MWTGQQTLHSIEKALNQVRDQLQQVDGQLQSTSRELVELRQEEGTQYRKLAQVRLGQLISGEITAGLDAADRRVSELLTQRDQALAHLQNQLEEARQEQARLEQEREIQSEKVARAAEILDTAEADIQEQLNKDPEYQAQLKKARNADNIARQAEEKTSLAETDRIEKGNVYEDDPLFTYLWKRGYGTSLYSANPLTRYLDQWVSRLCNYDDARPNYAMLLEIPKRLLEHAADERKAANDEFASLKQLDEKAAEEGGIPSLRKDVEEKEDRMETIDNEIRETEDRIRDLMQKRAVYAAGEDDYFRQCIETLAAAFQRENLRALHRHAKSTVSAEDDMVVYELNDLEENQKELKTAVREHKLMYDRHLARLKELEDVRRRFKRERYDDIHSVFANPDLLSVLLGQFLRGMTTSDDLWRTIQRGQRYRRIRSNPGFGSGGFGGGGVWRIPFPKGGGGRIRFPGSGGFGSGGGFRTGGGF